MTDNKDKIQKEYDDLQEKYDTLMKKYTSLEKTHDQSVETCNHFVRFVFPDDYLQHFS